MNRGVAASVKASYVHTISSTSNKRINKEKSLFMDIVICLHNIQTTCVSGKAKLKHVFLRVELQLSPVISMCLMNHV